MMMVYSPWHWLDSPYMEACCAIERCHGIDLGREMIMPQMDDLFARGHIPTIVYEEIHNTAVTIGDE
jgi:hypothetical protein